MGTQATSKVLGRHLTLLGCGVAPHVRCGLDRDDSSSEVLQKAICRERSTARTWENPAVISSLDLQAARWRWW